MSNIHPVVCILCHFFLPQKCGLFPHIEAKLKKSLKTTTKNATTVAPTTENGGTTPSDDTTTSEPEPTTTTPEPTTITTNEEDAIVRDVVNYLSLIEEEEGKLMTILQTVTDGANHISTSGPSISGSCTETLSYYLTLPATDDLLASLSEGSQLN